MTDPVATGIFTLAGVILGALLTPLTQVFLERERDQRMADKAKGLVALELIHNQLILRAASRGKNWPISRRLRGRARASSEFCLGKEAMAARSYVETNPTL
jgi:hypothetical protein